jgi:hypothetical protein
MLDIKPCMRNEVLVYLSSVEFVVYMMLNLEIKIRWYGLWQRMNYEESTHIVHLEIK